MRLRLASPAMNPFPDDIFTEPEDVDPDTLANLGPLTRLAGGTWIDVEAASNAIDEAEGAIRAGDDTRAWGCANVGVSIARRPFLAQEEAPWIEAQRVRLRALLARKTHA